MTKRTAPALAQKKIALNLFAVSFVLYVKAPIRAKAGSMNDKREMERLSRGDIAALGTLVRRYQTKALRAAYLITHDLAQAEDVVSSAFLRVFERAEQHDPHRPFGPWFYRIVVNDAIKTLQRKEVWRKCEIYVPKNVIPEHLAPLR